jgi:heat shock protein HtpX
MNQYFMAQSKNIMKTWLYMGLFFIFVIFLGWIMREVYGNSMFLYIAVGISLLMNITSYWFADKIALKVSGAKPMNESEFKDVYKIVRILTHNAGLPMPRLYIIEDNSMNAFATGRNANNSAIAFTRGIINSLNQDELEGVAAHELAHIGNRDILLQTVVVILAGFISILSDFLLYSGIFGGRDNNNSQLAIFGIILAIMSPFVAIIIQLAISRKREFLADATGAKISQKPLALASALEKISTNGLPMHRVDQATAHMFFASPFGNKDKVKKDFASKIGALFSTHPPVQERVQRLKNLA